MTRLKFLSICILLVIAIISVSAFTSKKYHKATTVITIKCLCYIGPRPATILRVLNPHNWAVCGPNGCSLPAKRICKVCFDVDLHPGYLNSDGSLNTDNTTVSNDLSAYYNDPTQDGITYDGITFYYEDED